MHFTDGSGGIAGPGGNFANFEVSCTSMDVVSRQGRDTLHLVKYTVRLSPEETVRRALRLVGRRGYDLLFDNCEHFAAWCVLGTEESRQVHVACERLGAAGVKVAVAGVLRSASRLGVRGVLRGATPWMVAADAAQWVTEAMGHHIGLRDARHRRTAGRAVGMATSLGMGVLGGPVGVAMAGGLWVAGEVVGEVSRSSYDSLRRRKLDARRALDTGT